MDEHNYTDWFWGLLEALGPAEAEAKVVPFGKSAQALVDAVASGATMPASSRERDPAMAGRFDPASKRFYQEIYRAAHDRPEQVNLLLTKHMPAGEEETSAYYEDPNIVMKEFNPFYSDSNRYTAVVPTALSYQQTLAHELLHFLLPKIAQDLRHQTAPSLLPLPLHTPKEREFWLKFGLENPHTQHGLMEYLFGRSTMPIVTGPTGEEQPNVQRLSRDVPFSPFRGHRSLGSVWDEALWRIVRDPALLQLIRDRMQLPGGK